MRAATLSLVLVSLALTACDRPAPGKPLRQVYQCGDLAVTAEFPTPDGVTLAWQGNSLALKRVPAASGAKYADDAGNEFWTQDGAMLTLAGQAMRRCTLK
jgi:membrane-bound inhibitor of C-type lysozyme